MPYLYKCRVNQSHLHGKGVFAEQNIAKGVLFWIWETQNPLQVLGCETNANKFYTKEQLYEIQDHQRLTKILHGGYYFADGDVFIELCDGAQWTNHSQNPNCLTIFDESKDYRKQKSFTIKQIKAGEEITENYGVFPSVKGKWVNDLMEKYLPQRHKLETIIAKQELIKKQL